MGDTQVSGRREEAAYADYRCVGDDHWTAASSRRLTFLMDERYMQNYRAGFGTIFVLESSSAVCSKSENIE